MRLIAKKAFPYGGRRLAAGDSFDASSRHARVLLAIGYATAPDSEPAEPEPDSEPAEPEPDSEPAEPEPSPARPARQYRRRDMQAET